MHAAGQQKERVMAEPIVILRPEELRELVRDAVADALRTAGVQSGAEWVPAGQCGLPERTVRREIKAGNIEGRRIGRKIFARRSSLEAWAAQRPTAERQELPQDAPTDAVQRMLAAGRLRVVPGAAAKAGR
jgi:hypothetical protein